MLYHLFGISSTEEKILYKKHFVFFLVCLEFLNSSQPVWLHNILSFERRVCRKHTDKNCWTEVSASHNYDIYIYSLEAITPTIIMKLQTLCNSSKPTAILELIW